MHANEPIMTKSDMTPGRAVAIGTLIGVGNDMLYIAFPAWWAIIAVDYVSHASMIGLYCLIHCSLPPLEQRSRVLVVGAGVSLACAGVWAFYVADRFEPIGRFIAWPRLDYPFKAIDLSVGLALTAIGESLIFTRLAFAAIGGSVWAKIFGSAALFGLIHWGIGLNYAIAATVSGVAFGMVFVITRSLASVVGAHYAIGLVRFGSLQDLELY